MDSHSLGSKSGNAKSPDSLENQIKTSSNDGTGQASMQDTPELSLEEIEQEKKLHFHFIAAKGVQACVNTAPCKVSFGTINLFVDFVEDQMLKKQMWEPSDWVYLTPYPEQAIHCEQKLQKLITRWNQAHPIEQITSKAVPQVMIADNAQSQEFEYVWYDVVSTDKLGFLVEDRRVTTHVTRVRNLLWIVADDHILQQPSDSLPAKKDSGTTGQTADEEPLLIRIIKWLIARECCVVKQARLEDGDVLEVPVRCFFLVQQWWLTDLSLNLSLLQS